MKNFLLPLAVLFALPSLQSQCLMLPISLQDQVTNSALVIEGQVMSERAFETTAPNFIYTAYKIKVTKIFKGRLSDKYVEIIAPGGIVGSRVIDVNPRLTVQEGEYATFFLEQQHTDAVQERSAGHPMYRGYASQQSVFAYDSETGQVRGVFETYPDISDSWYRAVRASTQEPIRSVGAMDFVIRRHVQSRATINNFSPTSAAAGTYTELTINGSGFGATRGTSVVEFRDANDGGSSWFEASDLHYQSWSNSQIKVWIPTTAGTGKIRVTLGGGGSMTSSGTLTIINNQYTFTVSSGGNDYLIQSEHNDDNGNGGYTFQYFTDFNNNGAARAAFERAMNTWRCNTGVNWIVGATTTVDVIDQDGTNVVRFDNGSELPAGVAGRATGYGDNCFFPGLLRIHMVELDIVFNNTLINGWVWQYGPALAGTGEVDFESVAVHELGHAHQLGHVINTNEVMHYSLQDADNTRTPAANEFLGADDVHSRSTANIIYCGESPMHDYRNVKYVDASASGIENGDSWSQAYTKLQDALADNTCVDTIYIATGTYYPDEGANQTNNNEQTPFTISSNIVLMGGYPAGGGVRDWTANPTILSGDIDKDGNVDAENSRTVVYFTGNGDLDGLIIEGGFADGPTGVARLGAGVRCNGSPDIRNCIFRYNEAPGNGSNGLGGAWYQAGGNPDLFNVLFHHNESFGMGGAVYLASGSMDCTNCTLADNKSILADGVFISSGAHRFRNSIFRHDEADIYQISSPSRLAGTLNISYSMLSDTVPADGVTGNSILYAADPLFANGYELDRCSPGINSGNNNYNNTSEDLLGNDRIKHTTIDRGAYEYQPSTSVPVVMNTLSSGAGSLRQAVIDACPDETITFSNALSGQTILLGGQIYLTKNLTIQGLGMDDLFISGNGNSRIFQISPGESATIRDLNIVDGFVPGTNGGIRNRGDLILENVRFTNNTAGGHTQTLRNQAGNLTIKGEVIMEN